MAMTDSGRPGLHVVTVRAYLLVFSALLLLTALTVWVALLDLG